MSAKAIILLISLQTHSFSSTFSFHPLNRRIKAEGADVCIFDTSRSCNEAYKPYRLLLGYSLHVLACCTDFSLFIPCLLSFFLYSTLMLCVLWSSNCKKGFQIIVSFDLSIENWPTCTPYYIASVCTCSRPYVCTYWTSFAPSLQIKHHPNQHAAVITFHFFRKAAWVYRKIYLQKVTLHSPTLSFCTTARSPPSFLNCYLPVPSVFLQSIPHQTNTACLAFQGSQRQHLSACHILSKFFCTLYRKRSHCSIRLTGIRIATFNH